jgi:hypothetical protein
MKLEDLKEGDVVKVDDGFPCIDAFVEKRVHIDAWGNLYVFCKKGKHLLDSQEDVDGELIGISKAA